MVHDVEEEHEMMRTQIYHVYNNPNPISEGKVLEVRYNNRVLSERPS